MLQEKFYLKIRLQNYRHCCQLVIYDACLFNANESNFSSSVLVEKKRRSG